MDRGDRSTQGRRIQQGHARTLIQAAFTSDRANLRVLARHTLRRIEILWLVDHIIPACAQGEELKRRRHLAAQKHAISAGRHISGAGDGGDGATRTRAIPNSNHPARWHLDEGGAGGTGRVERDVGSRACVQEEELKHVGDWEGEDRRSRARQQPVRELSNQPRIPDGPDGAVQDIDAARILLIQREREIVL